MAKSTSTYKVIYCQSHGGFSFDGTDAFYAFLNSLSDCANPRTDPRVIKFVEKEIHEHQRNKIDHSFRVEEVDSRLGYTVDDYDGAESLILYVPVTIQELATGLSAEKIDAVKTKCKRLLVV